MIPDSLYRVALEGIEWNARYVATGSRAVAHHVGILSTQRPFLTKARDAMDVAEAALTEALSKVRAAKVAYDNLPKETGHEEK